MKRKLKQLLSECTNLMDDPNAKLITSSDNLDYYAERAIESIRRFKYEGPRELKIAIFLLGLVLLKDNTWGQNPSKNEVVPKVP